jgi:FMN phosphatase YigB (HAD superfamily)
MALKVRNDGPGNSGIFNECVFIGDLWQTDLYGACLAGMKPVWMNTEGSPVQEYKKIPQIRRLRELLELNF